MWQDLRLEVSQEGTPSV